MGIACHQLGGRQRNRTGYADVGAGIDDVVIGHHIAITGDEKTGAAAVGEHGCLNWHGPHRNERKASTTRFHVMAWPQVLAHYQK